MALTDTPEVQYRQTTSIVDESFDQNKLSGYHLLLSLNKNTLLLAVADAARNKVIALEEYDLGRIYSALQTAEQLKLLFRNHPWLLSGTWGQVRCELHQAPYTLVPASLYDPAEQLSYFRLAGHFDPDHEQLLHYMHRTLDLVVLFSISNFLLDQLSQLSSREKIRIVHGASAFVEGVLHTQPRSSATLPYILVEPNHATIALLREGTVAFCNTFYFTTPEDFIYYVILVMQEHQLNPDQDPLLVWGELTPDSAIFSVLQKYIRNVSLGKRPATLSYSYRLEDLFPHRYFDLYSLVLCNG